MNVKDAFYHGVRQQITRVLKAMGEDRIEKGLTAFQDGASHWGACFFARAYPEVRLGSKGDPEEQVAALLGMPGNKVPMRIVYRTFDGVSLEMTKSGLKKFIEDFLDEQRPAEVTEAINDLLSKVNYQGAAETAIDFNEVCST